MNNMSINDVIALYTILQYISVKDLLTHAMNDIDSATPRDKDNASLLFYAIHTYLMQTS